MLGMEVIERFEPGATATDAQILNQESRKGLVGDWCGKKKRILTVGRSIPRDYWNQQFGVMLHTCRVEVQLHMGGEEGRGECGDRNRGIAS